MGNMLSYLKWRGDLTWEDSPFNQVDNLILSYLSYFDFNRIVPETETHAVTLEAAWNLFDAMGRAGEQMMDSQVLRMAAVSRRFGSILMWGYQDIVDTEQEMTQFSAIHFILEKGTEYIAFRGTDDTIVGWREDFRIGFEVVPAQEKAVRYLEETIRKDGSVRYLLGGHSKGGNLAVYGAMICGAETKEQIGQIYINDSPGLCPTIVDEGRYLEIKDRIVKIVPEFSIIGMLFEREQEKEQQKMIVKSSAEGILQHDALSWQIEGTDFIRADGLSPKAKNYNEIFDRWIESADFTQREVFVRDFFDALEAGGAKTVEEVAKGGADGFEAILLAMAGAEKDAKKAVGKLAHSFLEQFKRIDYLKLFREKKAIRGMAAFLAGAIFTITPGLALNILGTACFLWLFLFSLLRIQSLMKRRGQWRTEEKVKITFYGLIAALEMFCILFNRIVVISTNLILGFFLCWRAWHQAKYAIRMKSSGWRLWLLPALESIFAWVLFLVVLGKLGDNTENYILAVGAYLTVGGICTIGKQAIEMTKSDI